MGDTDGALDWALTEAGNIGNPGSGQRQNSIDALEAVGLNFESDMQAEQEQADHAEESDRDDADADHGLSPETLSPKGTVVPGPRNSEP